MNGASQATMSLVADWDNAGDTQRLAGFFRNGDTRAFYIMVNGDGTAALQNTRRANGRGMADRLG